MSTRALAFLCLLLAPSLRGDTGADLRKRLQALTGSQPVAAAVDVSVWSRGGFGDGTPEEGRTHFQLRGGGGAGIGFDYPAAELHRAESEERRTRANPDAKTPTMTAVREIDPLEAEAFLNFAPTLIGYLERGKVITDRNDTRGGRPARLLVIEVDPPIPTELRKRIREAHYRVSLWLGADGLPFAGEAALHGKARFLLLSFEHTESRRWTFLPRGDRLLVTSHVIASTGSGLGKKYERRVGVTLRPR